MEKIEAFRPAMLRKLLISEMKTGFCYGEDNIQKRAIVTSGKIGCIVEVETMVKGLAALLARYDDFTVECSSSLLHVKGMLKNNRKKRKKISSYFWLQYGVDFQSMLVLAIGGGEPVYCNQLELLDNLAGQAGVQLALLIQDDEQMKQFYLDYLDWLKPYWKQAAELRLKFAQTVAFVIGEIVSDYPKEEASAMPVIFNVPFLIHRMRQILSEYNLPVLESPSSWHLMGFRIHGAGMEFSCHIDFRSFNGMTIIYGDKSEQESFRCKVLNDKQSVTLIKELLQILQQIDTPLCRLFVYDMTELIYSMIQPEKLPDEQMTTDVLQWYLDTVYL